MRITFGIAVSSLVCTAYANTFMSETLAAETPNVNFDENLSCGACVVSGYKFCWKGQNRLCCKAGEVCMNDPGTKCSDDPAFQDLFTKLYKFCNKGTLRNETVCSNQTMINFEAIGNVSMINITNMTFGDSCSYRVFSKCGFPEIVVNSS